MAMAGGRRGAPRLVARGTGRPMGMGRCGLANPPRAPPGLHLHAARTHLLSVHHHGHGSLAYGWLYATKLHVPHRIQYVYAVAELVDKYRRGQAMYIFLCLTSLLPKLK
jgi:hypothetical protein